MKIVCVCFKKYVSCYLQSVSRYDGDCVYCSSMFLLLICCFPLIHVVDVLTLVPGFIFFNQTMTIDRKKQFFTAAFIKKK